MVARYQATVIIGHAAATTGDVSSTMDTVLNHCVRRTGRDAHPLDAHDDTARPRYPVGWIDGGMRGGAANITTTHMIVVPISERCRGVGDCLEHMPRGKDGSKPTSPCSLASMTDRWIPW
jgi:hypothetical protein